MTRKDNRGGREASAALAAAIAVLTGCDPGTDVELDTYSAPLGTAAIIGCCIGDGACVESSPDRCAGVRVPACLGDGDANGEDDACEPRPPPRPAIPEPDGCHGVHPERTPIEHTVRGTFGIGPHDSCAKAREQCLVNLRLRAFLSRCRPHCKQHDADCQAGVDRDLICRAEPTSLLPSTDLPLATVLFVEYETLATRPFRDDWVCDMRCRANVTLCTCGCVGLL